ncbi:hypothetical protein BC832DRAFT_520323, partial [Gaertneriomyces semiglobifer]
QETSRKWMEEEEIFALLKQGKKFVDVTDGWWDDDGLQTLKRPSKDNFRLPQNVTHQDIVEPLVKQISEDEMEAFLTEFSGFHTRYYRTASGKAASEWLYTKCNKIAESVNDHNGEVKMSVRQFDHRWGQSSVIVRMEKKTAENNRKKNNVLVLSAHLDSVNSWNPYWGRSPGADDDGSGTTTVFHALEILANAAASKNSNDGTPFVPEIPLEFHFYSAEEAGLLGSQQVVSSYMNDKDVNVVAVFHFDMTGYTPPFSAPIVGLATDYTNVELTNYIKKVNEAYCETKWGDVKCGYACSDHASWTKKGVKSAFAFEAQFDESSPYIHSPKDNVDNIDFGHVKEFVKVALGWAVEMS